MSELVQVRKKAQVTLPLSVRKKLNIEEGDFLDVQVRGGEVVLKVKKLVDKDQAWFWTKRWQEGEHEAEEDIKAGRVLHFPDGKAAADFLEAEARAYDAQLVPDAVHESKARYSSRRNSKQTSGAQKIKNRGTSTKSS